MSAPAQILVVDDDPTVGKLAGPWLEAAGYVVHLADSGEAAMAALEGFIPDAVLLDLRLPGMQGVDVLRAVAARTRHLPIVVLTARRDVQLAVECMKAGAFDFLNKPVDEPNLVTAARNAVRHRAMSFTVDMLRRRAEGGDLEEALDLEIDRIASAGASVLLRGPAGPRRQLVATALHQRSCRAGGPLVTVCAAGLSPEEQLAQVGPEGRAFGAAAGGTLLLEEPEALVPAAQASLAEAAADGARARQGFGSAPDFRLVAATGVDLGARTRMGAFRPDLHLRLSAVEVAIQPSPAPERASPAHPAASVRQGPALDRAAPPRHGKDRR